MSKSQMTYMTNTTTTSPPTRQRDTVGTGLSLERKLELLESRFTSPSSGGGGGVGSGGSGFVGHTSTMEQQQEHRTHQTTPSLSSPTASCHSFSFDPPSLSRSSSALASETMAASSSSNLPPSLVRPKRRNSTSSLRAVELAAERQMQKIAASRNSSRASSPSFVPLQVHTDDGERSLSAMAATNFSSGASNNNSNTSNRTLLTSHRSSEQQQQQHPVVVAESPPVLVTPKHDLLEERIATQGTTPTTATNGSDARDYKRKSVPVKRAMPSVTDAKSPANKTNHDTTTASRKRSRFLSTSSADNPTASSPKVLDMTLAASRDRSNPSRTTIVATTTAATTGPTSKAAAKAAPRGNRRLEDFYGTVTKRGAPNRHTATAAATAAAVAAPSEVAEDVVAGEVVAASLHPSSSSSESTESARLRSRVEELEKLCHDKEEQLKAVSNNRTILHTALKSALAQREKELAEAKQSKDRLAKNAMRVIETLVRSESARDARELREKLALDGARLGRIVYTRAGLRNTVESWEDGHATKQLQKKRKELQAQRKALEQRQEAARRAAMRVQDKLNNKENQSPSGTDGADVELVGGILIQNELDAVEAEESVRFHLTNIREKEKELDKEEQALNDEKGAHIRALKRVASEDASRFRSRPTLHERYVLLSLLGKGGFSEVWRAYDLVELREVAVKIHQLDPRWSDSKKENYTKHVSREYEIHRDVRHPRIVSLYDVFEIDANSFATVLECCDGTDLDSLLKTKRYLPERDARAILLQILSGMQYLSQPAADGSRQGIIHYDLKPGNILFDEHGDAKITDFGLSKIVDAPDPAESMELTSQGAGTYWYLPPECFITSQSVRISNKVDVWSIGVIFYQMLFGKRPFGDGQSQDRLITDHTMLNARDVKFPEKPQVSEAAKQFVRQCLSYDQTFRPTIGQLCQSAYVVKPQF